MYLSPATAIFMPSPLIEQWELQLKQHTDSQLRVLVYPQGCECVRTAQRSTAQHRVRAQCVRTECCICIHCLRRC
jgi:hypothetical protein